MDGTNTSTESCVSNSLGSHLIDDSSTLRLPFLSILQSIFKILVTGNSENAAFFEFLCEWNYVPVEKADFSLVPPKRRVLIGTTSNESSVTFLKEPFVPLGIYLPLQIKV